MTGTAVTSKGTVLLGNGPTDREVEVEIGDIAPNGTERIQIVFDVVISPQITLPLVRNQAVVTTIAGQNEPPTEEPLDDLSTPAIHYRHNLRDDRDGNLLWSAGADVDADGGVNVSDLLFGDAHFLQRRYPTGVSFLRP